MKNKKVIIVAAVAGIIVLVGLGPIIVARIMRKVAAGGRKMEQTKLIRAPLILEMRGEVSLQKDGIIMLTSDSDMRYILIGEKLDALKEKVGETITVLGKIKRPQPKEIDGNPIRYNITVTTWTDKPIDRKKALKNAAKKG